MTLLLLWLGRDLLVWRCYLNRGRNWRDGVILLRMCSWWAEFDWSWICSCDIEVYCLFDLCHHQLLLLLSSLIRIGISINIVVVVVVVDREIRRGIPFNLRYFELMLSSWSEHCLRLEIALQRYWVYRLTKRTCFHHCRSLCMWELRS